MQTYLVGGCVRDQLLGLPVKDRDWVVIGGSPQEMIEQGYQPVGKDFPVFLHPETKEEYALARTERKAGHGYHGFQINAAPDVTLEEDLARRDLTINAIAQDQNGTIIDPFNGREDLKQGILRHVSPAFIEDPVRVLRIARFAARFDFQIAEETNALIEKMVINGELEHLVPERVWQELSLALLCDKPSIFFTALKPTSALKALFPDVNRLFGVPQPAKWHPEIDTGVHAMLVLDQAAKLSPSLDVRFASLCHDLGKGTTPSYILPSHHGHEARSVDLTQKLCKHLRVPKETATIAVKIAEYHTHMHLIFELRPEAILQLFEALDAFRKPSRFDVFALTGEADFRGRPGYEYADMPEKLAFEACFKAAKAVGSKEFVAKGLSGSDIAQAIRKERLNAIKQALETFKQ